MDIDWPHLLGWLMAVLMIVLGFLGNLLPILPGAPLLFGGFLLGAWLDDFQRVGWGWLWVLGMLAALLAMIDFVAGAWGAQKVGASRQAVVGATLGSLIGMFFGLPGLLLGPFVGAFLGEWLARPQLLRAGGVGLATWLGMMLGAVMKVALSLMMIALFVFACAF